jgi:NarL family two-component system response regulator LiaR
MHAHERSPLNELTPRELDVREGTVKMHVTNILSKLHLADRTQAAIYALQKRVVPLSEALDPDSPS